MASPPPGGWKVDHILIDAAGSEVMVGETLGFAVKGYNKKGFEVPLTAPATASAYPDTVAEATVSPDGTDGSLLGVSMGTAILGAASGSLKATGKPIKVNQGQSSVKVVFGS